MHLLATIFSAVALIVCFLCGFILLLRTRSNRIFGIYPEKGPCYYLKYVLVLQVLRYWRRKIFYENEDKLSSSEYLRWLDAPQQLGSNPNSYDVTSFVGSNREGYSIFLTMERRRSGVVKAAFYLRIPGRGVFYSAKLPDMLYFTTDGESESQGFTAEGFRVEPITCMRRWKVSYDGDVRQGTHLFKLKFDCEFTSEMQYFDYNRHLSSCVIADSVSRESWDDQFFYMIRNMDKILETRMHYEQTGYLKGQLKLEGHDVTTLNLCALRDHSFGTQRCLSTIYRYVYFVLFLDDETSLVLGFLSQPSFFISSLKVGYICIPKRGYVPITGCNFELYSYGEKGIPPKHQSFIVNTAEGKHCVQIATEECCERYGGQNWESKIYLQFVSCVVNGIKGHGTIEYLYRHQGGRPEMISNSDPEWYRNIKSFEKKLQNGDDAEQWKDNLSSFSY